MQTTIEGRRERKKRATRDRLAHVATLLFLLIAGLGPILLEQSAPAERGMLSALTGVTAPSAVVRGW